MLDEDTPSWPRRAAAAEGALAEPTEIRHTITVHLHSHDILDTAIE